MLRNLNFCIESVQISAFYLHIWSLIPIRGKNVSFHHSVLTGAGVLPASYPSADNAQGSSVQNVELPTYLHPLPRLGMCGAVPCLFYMASCHDP